MTDNTNNYVCSPSQPDDNAPHLLSRKQAAAYLGVKPQTLAMWRSSKQHSLPVVKIGRLAKYLKTDLDAFIVLRRQKEESQISPT